MNTKGKEGRKKGTERTNVEIGHGQGDAAEENAAGSMYWEYRSLRETFLPQYSNRRDL